MNDPIGDRCLGEIERLHRFFERWLGDAATDPAEFTRTEPAWPSDFTLITPDGATLDRAAVTGWLRRARGVHADPADIVMTSRAHETALARRILELAAEGRR